MIWIVMDVMMPELDGFSAVREIRKVSQTPGAHAVGPGGEEYDRIHGVRTGGWTTMWSNPSPPKNL